MRMKRLKNIPKICHKVSANLIDEFSVNAIGCGKVREMTHGVFYIINDRRCISKYQIMCHLYTTKACRNNNTTGFINKTITIVTSSIPRESLASHHSECRRMH